MLLQRYSATKALLSSTIDRMKLTIPVPERPSFLWSLVRRGGTYETPALVLHCRYLKAAQGRATTHEVQQKLGPASL